MPLPFSGPLECVITFPHKPICHTESHAYAQRTGFKFWTELLHILVGITTIQVFFRYHKVTISKCTSFVCGRQYQHCTQILINCFSNSAPVLWLRLVSLVYFRTILAPPSIPHLPPLHWHFSPFCLSISTSCLSSVFLCSEDELDLLSSNLWRYMKVLTLSVVHPVV